ncbi:MAG: response regulator [Lachnospiraceae bacterium]|nr:response regulator [Lachnospiraceae bacterium]
MWVVSCILLILGTLSSVLGISFYIRNREAEGNIKYYILFIGITSAIWCFSYGMIGMCGDIELCHYIRKFGVIGINSFLVSEAFLVTEMSGVNKSIASVLRAASIVMGIADYLIYSVKDVDIFIRKGDWTTWIGNPDYAINRHIHSLYIVLIFLILFCSGLVWIKTNDLKRHKRFMFMVFLSNFVMLFFTFPDTFLPAMGKDSIATSGMGAAFCTVVMWYGATQLNTFDVRMGNVKDRLFEFMEAGVIVFDMKGELAVINEYAKQFTDTYDFKGKHISDLFDIEEEAKEEMFKKSINDIYDTRLWDRGRTRACSVKMNALKDDFGDPFCYLCVFADITEEVEAVSKLEIASLAKSRFLAQMSHEIRTPINAVLGMNEMILREAENEQIIEYAENIDSAGNTLLSLINSILDFSKIEDGKMDIVSIQYDTASFINDLVNSISQKADTKGIAFIVDIDDRLPCELIGDNIRFSQVIMNLLTNAVKYTEKGSVTLTVKTEKIEEDNIELYVSVEDTGIGIKKEDIKGLFESFVRLDEMRNHNIEGTGLGISIITNLLDLMGSSLRVESEYGKGSKFFFTITQKVADPKPIGNYLKRLREGFSRREKDPVLRAPGAKVLLVDDNDMNLKVARNLLKLCGIKPDMASSGMEAIEAMRARVYDIVFLDHMMPKMDGIETLHEIEKEDLLNSNTVIIALTANAVLGARETYLKEGFGDYLSKPIEFKQLVEKLEKYLPEKAYEEKEVPDPLEKENKEHEDKLEVMEFDPESDEEIMEFSADEEGEEINSCLYDMEKLKLKGVNTKSALNYCANEEGLYFEVLDEFVSGYEKKIEILKSLFESANLHDYEIEVHSLKGNARTIGADKVYQEAKALEEAAGRKDREYIEKKQEELFEYCRSLSDAIRECRS